MKKAIQELQKKSAADLVKEINKTVEEISMASVEGGEARKDTNYIAKKKQYLAQLKTVLSVQEMQNI